MVEPSTQPITSGELISTADQRILMHGVPWSHYEVMLAVRGEAAVPRMAYLEGVLELMSPSREHEMIKSVLRKLVEAFADQRGVDLWPVGSWTVGNPAQARGAEPDECYTIGDPRLKPVPDLAIEIVWTRGGLDKLDIYRGLGVREVWMWKNGHIGAHVLRNDRYVRVEASEVLPGIDLALIARLASDSPRDAVDTLKAALQGGD